MKEKSPQEQSAAARQVELLVNALDVAAHSDGYWLNAAGRTSPRFFAKTTGVSAFNSLVMGLHSDQNGYSTAQYTTFNEARKNGDAILQKERGIPFNWYRWDNYVNRHDPTDKMSREDYLKLEPSIQALYKGVRQREIRTIFNIDQTTLPMTDADRYKQLLERSGRSIDRGNLNAEERQLRRTVNQFLEQMRTNLVPVRKDSAGMPHYDTVKDAVYIPEQKHFGHYNDYVQELMRQIVSATGHQQRLAREGMVMSGGKAPSQSALKYESLVTEVAAGVKMMELGLPAKLSSENIPLIEYWNRELQENPCLIDALESDINNTLDVIRKAERGDKIEYATLRNNRQTEDLREKQKPQVDSREALILTDILRYGGLHIDNHNFDSHYDRMAFLDKFDLAYYEGEKKLRIEQTKEEDPEIVEIAFTEALAYAARIQRICEEFTPNEWEAKGSFTISDNLKNIPNRKSKEMVIVMDNERNMADVILPAGAMSGGHVVMPSGDKRMFLMTPDEVMSAAERKEQKARVVGTNIPGFSKERIENALVNAGATYVRFFNNDGRLGYRPDDSYYNDKTVTVATLDGKNLRTVRELDVSEAVRQATQVQFDRIQMVRDDDNRWALYLKPAGENGFCVYPGKEDINRFFSTVKQQQHVAADSVRNELAQKYYALTQNRPDLKQDLLSPKPENVDTSKIQRVNVFRTKDDRMMCMAVINGVEKLQPREISRQQWQRMWITEDVAEYKTNLAAKIFADVLGKAEKQAETVSAGKEAETEEQDNTVRQGRRM